MSERTFFRDFPLHCRLCDYQFTEKIVMPMQMRDVQKRLAQITCPQCQAPYTALGIRKETPCA